MPALLRLFAAIAIALMPLMLLAPAVLIRHRHYDFATLRAADADVMLRHADARCC